MSADEIDFWAFEIKKAQKEAYEINTSKVNMAPNPEGMQSILKDIVVLLPIKLLDKCKAHPEIIEYAEKVYGCHIACDITRALIGA